jgi:hypothetical protein
VLVSLRAEGQLGSHRLLTTHTGEVAKFFVRRRKTRAPRSMPPARGITLERCRSAGFLA